MLPSSHSSGDLLADRRFGYAADLMADNDAAAAADLLEQTLERVPGWVPAWVALGLALERSGRPEAARDAFASGAALDGSGWHGAGLHLARLDGAASLPAAMPPAYVAALFDDYAPRFDTHLVDALGYRGPALLADALTRAAGDRRFAAAIDLGCGTGLMAGPVRGRVDRLTGVDLSAAMVAIAAATGRYDRLVVGDLLDALADEPAGAADLVLAADVFVYLGPLGPVLRAVFRVLATGGALAFTVQRSDAGAVRLGPDLRFAHARSHVVAALAEAGLDPLLVEDASTRRDAGAAVPGLVVVARRP